VYPLCASDPGGFVFDGMAITESAVNGAEFDQTPREPKRHLIVCTTPRSGSYLLARQLIRAGLGIPHEYLNVVNSSVIIPRVFGGVDPQRVNSKSYVDWLEPNRTTPNGVFAAKLHWPDLEDNPELVERWLRKPGAVCIFLHRRRLLAQAVSYQASMRTGIWDVGGEVSTPPRSLPGVSNRRETDQLAYRLVTWNGMWRFLFESNGIDAVELAYEDFVANQSKTIAEIATMLDVPCDVPEPESYSESGTRTNADARKRYVQTWAYPGEGARSLGYSTRFASGAILDASRRGANRILSLSPIPLRRGHFQ
jgi:LPS sulfotransferase NodH